MTTAVLTKVTRKTYGGGKPMVIAEWANGDKGVAFAQGKAIGEFDHLGEGDNTEYSLKPSNQEGKDPLITFIKKAGANGSGGGSTSSSPARTFSRSEGDDDKQLSISMSYAKDLVAAGTIKPATPSISAVVDLVGALAVALKDKYDALRKLAKNPEAAAAPKLENPQ